MTYLCVSIFADDPAETRRQVAAAAEAGADMVELRIDNVSDIALARAIARESSLPCILTCRPIWEGGQCDLPDSARLPFLRQLFEDSAASYIDIELAAWRAAAHFSLPREKRAGLIISSHDFSGRPDKLYNLLAELNASGSDVNKIVWTARTIRDNLEAFEILRTRQKPTIALCMGETGLISRVLARKFGAFLTFAALDRGGGTAPGQLSVADMKKRYRWDAIGPATRVYGVVAQPVGHSMSPAIHNAAFEHVGHDGVYLPMLVEGSYESFKAFLTSFLAFEGLDLSGLSITIPHKENALRYLQESGGMVEPLAARIGAVNTLLIKRENGRVLLEGRNTDYAAILDSITSALGISRQDLAGIPAAVLGAGGTGRTAVAALAACGADVTVYNRTMARAEDLAHEFDGRRGRVLAASFDALAAGDYRILINTTSVGMSPKVDQSPLPSDATINRDCLVFDTIYNPLETLLLRQAKAAGAKTVAGIEMFVRQAALQFEAWIHQPAPVDVMRRVVTNLLTGR